MKSFILLVPGIKIARPNGGEALMFWEQTWKRIYRVTLLLTILTFASLGSVLLLKTYHVYSTPIQQQSETALHWLQNRYETSAKKIKLVNHKIKKRFRKTKKHPTPSHQRQSF